MSRIQGNTSAFRERVNHERLFYVAADDHNAGESQVEPRAKTRADAINAIASLPGRALPYLIDELWLRLLRARNTLEGHATDLERVLYVRAEWGEVQDLIDMTLEALTRAAEDGKSEDELQAAATRFQSAWYKQTPREETMPW